ncbi:DUF3021 domain-containing protein [Solibacillus sp. FSL R7-0668]|uniref:DUF3021 domain-containing protein n=1 Tax=Solibacillus sp. FSL R7-0668 TaxID=2921688 RepID=UPI0030F6F5ED
MRFLQLLLICVLISLSCSYIIMSSMIYASPNDVMTGKDLLEQVFIAILLGIAISFLSFIFEVERIPFIGQLLLHFFGILVCVFTAGYFGNWYDITDFSTIVIVFILLIIIYCFTWWLIQILLKRDIKNLNKSIKKRRGETE